MKVDLSKVSFLHCQGIEKFRFIDVDWAHKVEWTFYRDTVIYDEIKIDEGHHENYELVGEVYRKLRIGYERVLRFSEAGDFYVGDMEMMRRNAISKKRYADTLLITLYKWFSYYGGECL